LREFEAFPYRPTPLEVASGVILGFGRPESLPSPEEAGAPLEALEKAIMPALLRAPCLVHFSGDPASSALLTVAVRLARREGLEVPVPATNCLPHAEDERACQERVIVLLGLTDWARFELNAELDLVGPVAMSMLRRHGLMAPFNMHCQMPLIDEASGGSFITAGVGSGACVSSAGRGSLPLPEPPGTSWLRAKAAEEVWARWKHDFTSKPLLWRHRFAWLRRLRAVQLGMDSLTQIAAPLRVQVLHPFFDPLFSAGLRGLPSAAATRELFGELLPTDLLVGPTERRSDYALWNRLSRALVATWNGEGIDPELVDGDALRDEWSKVHPDRRSFLLLQSVALAREGRSVARQLAEAISGIA
jgi:hypothetical protein